jgi:hypothetical protein
MEIPGLVVDRTVALYDFCEIAFHVERDLAAVTLTVQPAPIGKWSLTSLQRSGSFGS